MSAQDTITKLREQNALMSAVLKARAGVKLDADEQALLAEFVKQQELEAALAADLELSGAITKAFRPKRATLPAQDLPTEKASGDNLEGAILKAFTGRKPAAQGAAPQVVAAMDGLRKALDDHAADELAKATTPKRTNVRSDMLGLERQS